MQHINPEQSIDPNKIAVGLVARALAATINSVISTFKNGANELRVRLRIAFTDYIEDQVQRRSRVKTIIYRDSPRPIYDFYIAQSVGQNGKTKIGSLGAQNLLELTKHAVISAPGGYGKSMLLRHLFVDFATKLNYIPLFIDLRNINADGETFESVLFSEIKLSNSSDTEVLVRCLKSGVFCLLLDGLDEVNFEKRDEVCKSIQKLTNESPETPVIVTSRPDERFIGWDRFEQLNVLPFSQDKAEALIKVLDYDANVKNRFLAAIQRELWGSHQSFLQNPLLLTVMLLTYEYQATISTTMSSFYGQVFETLWYKHDATKDGYKRRIRSGLSKEQFLDILQSFGFYTYWNNTIAISEADFALALDFARQTTGHAFDNLLVRDDLIQALCILNLDGLMYSFSHRSFQEYFAAKYFVSSHTEESRKQLTPTLLERLFSDQVLLLAWELDQRMIEREVLIPQIDVIRNAVLDLTGTPRRMAWVRMLVSGLYLQADGEYLAAGGTAVNDLYSVVQFIIRRYDGNWYSDYIYKQNKTSKGKKKIKSIGEFDVKKVRNSEHAESYVKLYDYDDDSLAAWVDLIPLPVIGESVLDRLLDIGDRMRRRQQSASLHLSSLVSPKPKK
ncbi:MAG: NACHT domain-containing protein [Phycisphaerales bacterium]